MIPCLVRDEQGQSKCAADRARARLAAGAPEFEREQLERDAASCDVETPDPWEAGLKWQGCPGKLAWRHPDVQDALEVRGLSKLHPLSDFPRGYTARVIEAWALIDEGAGHG